MPISESQAKANHAAYSAAMMNPVKCKITGNLLVFNEDKNQWVSSDKKASDRDIPNIRLGWMGKVYGPDSNGFIKEIVGRENGKKIFGEGIPRQGFDFHKRNILTNKDMTKYEIIEVGNEQKTIDKMSVSELIEFGVSKGLAESELEVMTKKDLISLLSK